LAPLVPEEPAAPLVPDEPLVPVEPDEPLAPDVPLVPGPVNSNTLSIGAALSPN
jgi:hypothetical protein